MYTDSKTYTHENIGNDTLRSSRINCINCTRPEDRKSEQRIIRNRIRRQQEMKKNFLILVMTICFILTCSFTMSVFHSNAKNNPEISHKYYKSITVSDNDTLWSIAEKYREENHYDSLQDYIDEIKRINSLSGDSIYYGDYLIIPYYDCNPVE